MALSEGNPYGSSQLKGLLDLLTDLNLLDYPEKSPEISPPLNETNGQDEALSTQSMEECQDSYTQTNTGNLGTPEVFNEANATLAQNVNPALTLSPINKPETNLPIQPPLNQEQPQVDTNGQDTGSILANDNAVTDNSLTAVEGLLNLLTQSYPQQEQPESSNNQSLLADEDLSQPEQLEASSEKDFNQQMKSLWKEANLKEEKSKPTLVNNKNLENSIDLFERWQRLILTQEVMDSREQSAKFKKQLESLEHQIYEPTELINLLLPLITEILSRKVTEAREDVAHAIAPIIDEMIQRRTQQDKVALSSALAPVLPYAVAQQVSKSPGDLAKALGPEMGPAIKEQINLERDAMVDALYPVIGSTISKYMAEVVRSINEKVENTLSLEGISRKIRAKMQGVSEAELILKESMPFTIQAIFLIHKGSGLVIAEWQPSDRQRLESEMVAGMLTAIRSFVNDCIVQSGDVSEIDQIDYGNSKIVLEVAGYCYLAVVTQGQPPKSFIKKMRGALGMMVQKHGKAIELFDGDPSNVPEQINQILQDLTKLSQSSTEAQKRKPPVALIVVGLAAMSAIVLPVGIYHHLSAIDRRREENINFALASDPQLAVYRVTVDANLGTVKLSGKLPNQYLRGKAEQLAKSVEPKVNIKNAIIPVEVPADPVQAAAEVKRVTTIINQMEGALIWAEYSEGKVTVKGAVLQEADARRITEAFQQIPGVESVTNTVQLQPLAIASRVYFDQGSSEFKSSELSKIISIKEFLKQYPNKQLKLVGHTDPKGTSQENQQLAVERAKTVKDALVAQGIDAERLHVEGTTEAPLGIDANQAPYLSRCVEFEIITP